MTWPVSQPGLVVRYAYLWRREALAGREEALKDRPFAVVVALQSGNGTRVYALPITHVAPSNEASTIEIPNLVKKRLGLDGERSWIAINEANVFNWPGPDLRLLPGKGPDSAVYGFLPPSFFRLVRDRLLATARDQKVTAVARTE